MEGNQFINKNMKYLKKYRLIENINHISMSSDYKEAKEILNLSYLDIEDIIDAFELSNIPIEILQKSKCLINKSGQIVSQIDNVTTYLTNDAKNEYHICHFLQIRYTFKNIVKYLNNNHGSGIDIEEFNKILSNINHISNEVLNLCKRIEKTKNVEISSNAIIEAIPSDENSGLIYKLKIIENKKIPNEIIKRAYDDWSKSPLVKGINSGIDKLKEIYRKRGIIDPQIDINDGELDQKIINIGFFTEDEIMVIARYLVDKGDISIDWDELEKSIRSYEKIMNSNERI